MRYLKKILFYLMIILTFTISFSNEENRITIYERENEPAKLKIGVTKMITKELAMDFDAEKKIIYCEVPEEVTENDSIYVSETLDEIPSTSTTNGRKTINNINKYLTKDVKANANFNYKVVDVNDEATGEVKKYLVINCKNPVSSVYLYIVENGTYKMKGLYRGKFVVSNYRSQEINYGTIEITENVFDRHESRRIFAKDGKPAISMLSQLEIKDNEASKYIDAPNYPKKLENGNKFDAVGYEPYYEVEISSSNGLSLKSTPARLKGKKSNEINAPFKFVKEGKEIISIHVKTEAESEYYYLDIRQLSPCEEMEYTITVKYGKYNLFMGEFVENATEIHKFNLKMAAKKSTGLPENTRGSLVLQNTKGGTNRNGEFEVSFDGERLNIKGADYFENTFFYGEKLEILDYSKYSSAFTEGKNSFLRIRYNSNAKKDNTETWEKKLPFTKIISNKNINITEDDFKRGDELIKKGVSIYDEYNKELGEIIVFGEGKSEEKSYFKLKIKPTGEWPKTHKDVLSTLTFEYITTDHNGKEVLLKKDTLNIAILEVPENIPPETHGTLFIKSTKNLPGCDFFIRNGNLEIEKNEKFNKSNASLTGELPAIFATNNGGENWLNTENGFRVHIVYENGEKKTKDINLTTGRFQPVKDLISRDEGWITLKSNSGSKPGFIYISSGGINDNGKESITIGFREDNQDAATQKDNFNWEKGDKGIYEKFRIQYQIDIDDSRKEDWMTVKEDVFEVVIQNDLQTEEPEITLNNPLVYYDYNSSSAISNIVHNRRAHISSEAPKTLNKNGSNFIKNRDLDGNEWIETKNISDYEWERLGKHKLSITRGADEVIKNTNDNGGTKSSTYLSGDNSRNGTKNEIMFSYDGGNKYLNFGVSKYNFNGETIDNVVITHFDGSGKYLEDRQTYTIKIPRFEGIHYMGNYDISPRESYTKDYEYNQDLDNKKPVIIDYGRIGFRNLDTRITNQSGGEGIDFRATRKVKLVSEDGTYVIKGAELYFEKDESDDNNETTLFKGENEKATSAMLKLKIPAQETLIPKGRFTILTDDENNLEKDGKNPLRIGVTVNGDKDKYYTYIGAKERGERGKDIYLNITTNRYIETTVEFENPALTTERDRWVRLNKSNYSFGELTKPIGDSLLWGRVRGEVIDIPVEYNGKKYDNLILKVFQQDPNGNELEVEKEDLTGKQVSFAIPEEPNKNFVMRYNKGDNFIEFSLDKGYDDSIKNREDIVFYIRYIDGSKEEDKGFLFDQKYIVKFKEKVDYKGDITVRFKNPSMARTTINNTEIDKEGDKGIIDLIIKSYVTGGNHDTTIDSIDWVDIGISQDTIDKIKADIPDNITDQDYTLNEIKGSSENIAKDLIIQLDKNQFKIALPNSDAGFENIFGNYSGDEIDKSFELKFNGDPQKAYRLNIIIDKFDPKYYGKVFKTVNDIDTDPDTTEYKEINLIGDGAINLTETNVKEDGFVYVDLNTSYRDYVRYKALPKILKDKDLKITLPKEVEAIPRNSNYAKPVKGDIVLFDGEKYTDNKVIDFVDEYSTDIPKNYPLKLKLSLKEYQRLRPYTKYEIYQKGNHNVLTIGAEKLKDNIIMDKPLNFYANGPILEIENGILDFGKIVPENLPNKLNAISGTTKNKDGQLNGQSIRIKLNPLDNNLGNITRNLELEGDITWIKQLSATGETMENGGTLKVRDLVVEKSSTTEGTEATNQVITETYDVSGILEVPKNIERSKYGSYEGTIILHYTFY